MAKGKVTAVGGSPDDSGPPPESHKVASGGVYDTRDVGNLGRALLQDIARRAIPLNEADAMAGVGRVMLKAAEIKHRFGVTLADGGVGEVALADRPAETAVAERRRELLRELASLNGAGERPGAGGAPGAARGA